MQYVVTCWGARGSIPSPGPGTVRYGGNTPCLQVQRDDDPNGAVILDAGTGIRGIGQQMGSEQEYGRVSVDVILSHTHWDHIQGFPFFVPLFEEGNEVRIWGAKQAGVDLETILRDQMRAVVFPVPLDNLSAEVSVHHVETGGFEAAGFHVQCMRVRHPANTMGYVLEPNDGGKKFAFVPDNELSGGHYPELPDSWRQDFIRFLDGVDVLIHDAMYAPEEIPQFSGWGHSSSLEAVELAHEAGVPNLVLFHHRPEHDDGTIDALVEEAQQAADRLGGVKVTAAFEGLKLNL